MPQTTFRHPVQEGPAKQEAIMIATKDTEAARRAAVLPAQRTCEHHPPCPTAEAPDREAALLVASHPEQGWGLLCNGVVLFDDTGELLPDGRVVAPTRRTG